MKRLIRTTVGIAGLTFGIFAGLTVGFFAYLMTLKAIQRKRFRDLEEELDNDG